MKESDLQKAILKYLNAIGILAWRNNTGAFAGEYKGRKRFVRFGTPGAADIFAILPGGRFWAIEVKSKGKKPGAMQTAWGEMIRRQGGLWSWVDSWEAFAFKAEREVGGER